MWIVASLPALAGGALAFGQALVKRTPIAVAFRVAWPLMRTFGFVSNQLTGALGLDPRGAAAFRALSTPPFMGSFLAGVAYDSPTEVAEGWLNWWVEAFVEGTVGNRMTFGMLQALGERDPIKMGDILIDSFAEAKLEEPAKFFNGWFRVLGDIEEITGAGWVFTWATAALSDFLRRLSTGDVIDLDDLIDQAEDLLGDLGGGVIPPTFRGREGIPVPAGGDELSGRMVRELDRMNLLLGRVGSLEPVARLATTAFSWNKAKMENDAAVLKKLVAIFSSGLRPELKGRGLGRPRFPAPLPRGGQPREFD